MHYSLKIFQFVQTNLNNIINFAKNINLEKKYLRDFYYMFYVFYVLCY
jgi:hypothetical protein